LPSFASAASPNCLSLTTSNDRLATSRQCNDDLAFTDLTCIKTGFSRFFFERSFTRLCGLFLSVHSSTDARPTNLRVIPTKRQSQGSPLQHPPFRSALWHLSTSNMNTLKIPEAGLRLDGPDSSSPGQAFPITLSDSVIEGMVNCVRNGGNIELALGSTPVCCILFGRLSNGRD
jgi:hypothetical protein